MTRELKLLRQLKHENIVNLVEAFRRRGKLYLVFEYVERTMLELLDEFPNGVSSKITISLTYQLLKAVVWCHTHNVIHRDIKPENLLIGPQNILKLCDFGFARTTNNQNHNPYTEYVATRWYRAPELLVALSYGQPVDIWSCGCIMGELADGQAVFPGESDIDQLYCIQKRMGKLPAAVHKAFFDNPRFRGLKLPQMNKGSTLQAKYKKLLSRSALDLMSSMLVMEVEGRALGKDCLAHRVFHSLRVSDASIKLADGDEAKARLKRSKSANQRDRRERHAKEHREDSRHLQEDLVDARRGHSPKGPWSTGGAMHVDARNGSANRSIKSRSQDNHDRLQSVAEPLAPTVDSLSSGWKQQQRFLPHDTRPNSGGSHASSTFGAHKYGVGAHKKNTAGHQNDNAEKHHKHTLLPAKYNGLGTQHSSRAKPRNVGSPARGPHGSIGLPQQKAPRNRMDRKGPTPLPQLRGGLAPNTEGSSGASPWGGTSTM